MPDYIIHCYHGYDLPTKRWDWSYSSAETGKTVYTTRYYIPYKVVLTTIHPPIKLDAYVYYLQYKYSDFERTKCIERPVSPVIQESAPHSGDRLYMLTIPNLKHIYNFDPEWDGINFPSL